MLRGVRLRQVASQARARSGHGREAIGRPWRGTVAAVADAFVALPGEDPDNLKFSPTIRTRVQMSRCPDGMGQNFAFLLQLWRDPRFSSGVGWE